MDQRFAELYRLGRERCNAFGHRLRRFQTLALFNHFFDQPDTQRRFRVDALVGEDDAFGPAFADQPWEILRAASGW